jgi:hypothetical protein
VAQEAGFAVYGRVSSGLGKLALRHGGLFDGGADLRLPLPEPRVIVRPGLKTHSVIAGAEAARWSAWPEEHEDQRDGEQHGDDVQGHVCPADPAARCLRDLPYRDVGAIRCQVPRPRVWLGAVGEQPGTGGRNRAGAPGREAWTRPVAGAVCHHRAPRARKRLRTGVAPIPRASVSTALAAVRICLRREEGGHA